MENEKKEKNLKGKGSPSCVFVMKYHVRKKKVICSYLNTVTKKLKQLQLRLVPSCIGFMAACCDTVVEYV